MQRQSEEVGGGGGTMKHLSPHPPHAQQTYIVCIFNVQAHHQTIAVRHNPPTATPPRSCEKLLLGETRVFFPPQRPHGLPRLSAS